jgi:hypothetical protein
MASDAPRVWRASSTRHLVRWIPTRTYRFLRFDVGSVDTTRHIGCCSRWKEVAPGWAGRHGVEEQRLAGVRALYSAIGAALADDLEQLVDLRPVLDDLLSKHGPARQYLEAFQLGLGRLTGLIELLADTRHVVWYTSPDGRRLMDLFQSAEPG